MIAVQREKNNPIIVPGDVKPLNDDFEVVGVFNPGVTMYKGEVLLLLRVAQRPKDKHDGFVRVPVYNAKTKQMDILKFDKDDRSIDFSDSRIIKLANGEQYLTSYSSFVVATSKDGVHFNIRQGEYITPSSPEESFGIEDPRITEIDGTYYIVYATSSRYGIVANLITTKDFVHFDKKGTIMHPDNKDVCLFPEKINGKFYTFHRPSTSEFGKPELWVAESPDALCWGNHKHVMSTRKGCWDSTRIGSSSVPIRTEYGWLEIYHGADEHNKYCLGAVLLDLNDPSKVLIRSEKPFICPETDYEKNGWFSNVIFACGSVVIGDNINIYYGAADKYVAKVTVSKQELLESLLEEKRISAFAQEEKKVVSCL